MAAESPEVLVLREEREPDEVTVRAFKAGVDAFNAAQAGADRYAPLWIIGRDHAGGVRAGLHGHSAWGWLFVDWLWVHERYRGHGLGADLMRRAEAVGRERHCIGVYLNTYTFQAPRFYERLGYREFGRLRDMPPGQARIWFEKRL